MDIQEALYNNSTLNTMLIKEQLEILREKFKGWEEDWNSPDMDCYDKKKKREKPTPNPPTKEINQ